LVPRLESCTAPSVVLLECYSSRGGWSWLPGQRCPFGPDILADTFPRAGSVHPPASGPPGIRPSWARSGTRGGGSGGSGGVVPRRRLRTVRSSGVAGPRDSLVSLGRARLSEPSIRQIEAAGRVRGSEGVFPLAVGPTGVGLVRRGAGAFRTSLGVRVLIFPFWGGLRRSSEP
jgi:hypothetical protein